MPTPTSNENKNREYLSLKVLTAILMIAIAAVHIGSALKGQAGYRDMHLGTALHYAATKIDLAHTIIVGFNATNTPTIQELPLWQAAVGGTFKLLGYWRGWGNVVSLIFFFTGLYPLFQITKMYLGERIAWWSLIFFLGEPLVFTQAGVAGTDGMSIAIAIWFWYYAAKLLEQPTFARWFPAALLGILSALTKLPFFMATGLAVFFLLLKYHRSNIRNWIALGGIGVIAGVTFLIWTKFTDSLQAHAVFPFVDLRTSTNPEMLWWYFGDWAYRLSPGNWVKGAWRMFNGLFGCFAMLGLVIYSWRKNDDNAFARFALFGCVIVTMIFSHLVLAHWHYYLMFSAPFAILFAQAVVLIEGKVQSTPLAHPWQSTAFIGFLLGASLFQGLMGMKFFLWDKTYDETIIHIIQQYTRESDKLAIQNGGWGGDMLVRSKRNGLSIWSTQIFEKPENYQKLKSFGFNKLVMISESPLLNAVKKGNPGQTRTERILYKEATTPIINGWPTLYQDDNILIKEIP